MQEKIIKIIIHEKNFEFLKQILKKLNLIVVMEKTF